MQLLQEKITEGLAHYRGCTDLHLDKGKMRIVSEENLSKLSFSDIAACAGDKTCWGAIKNGHRATLHFAEKAKGQELKPLKYNRAKCVREPYTDDRQRLLARLSSIKTGLFENDPALHINTGSYRKMKKAFDQVLTAVEQDEAEKLPGLFSALRDTSQAYIDSKGALPSSQFGKNRLELARDMRDMSKDFLSVRTKAPQEKKQSTGSKGKTTAKDKKFLKGI